MLAVPTVMAVANPVERVFEANDLGTEVQVEVG